MHLFKTANYKIKLEMSHLKQRVKKREREREGESAFEMRLLKIATR